MPRRKKYRSLEDFGTHIDSLDATRLKRRIAYESGNFAAMYDALAAAADEVSGTSERTARVPYGDYKAHSSC